MVVGKNEFAVITESLQSVCHCLILHHVNQSPAQAEVGEDEEHVLQDVVDAADFLKKQQSGYKQLIFSGDG